MAKTALQTTKDVALNKVEAALIQGDLKSLSSDERLSYYRQVCESVGLNPLTKPFEYVTLNGKLTLYALKGATDQLRKLHDVSIEPPQIQDVNDLFIVTVTARDASGRTDSDVGVVGKKDMGGNVGNALMKAITKAKRRVTLSICGLGMLDETEVETIPNAVKFDDQPKELPAPKAEDDKTKDLKEQIAEQCRQLNALGDDREWTPATLNAFAREVCGNDYGSLNHAGLVAVLDALDARAQPMRDAMMEAEAARHDDDAEAF